MVPEGANIWRFDSSTKMDLLYRRRCVHVVRMVRARGLRERVTRRSLLGLSKFDSGDILFRLLGVGAQGISTGKCLWDGG